MTSSQYQQYEYATGELLDDPNTYSYAAFRGIDFLRAWRSQRDAAGQASAAVDAQVRHSRDSATALLLREISAGLSSSFPDQALATLDRLLQRFEVTKRVHGEYNDNWRPVDLQDYRDLSLYLHFAVALDQAYSLTRRLQYLNGLLKCLDTLTAYQHDINIEQAESLQALILAEKRHVDALLAALERRDA